MSTIVLMYTAARTKLIRIIGPGTLMGAEALSVLALPRGVSWLREEKDTKFRRSKEKAWRERVVKRGE